MNGFWVALGITFWAEMGDKSQLMILGYATRFRFREMIIGIVLGTAAVLLLPALLGGFIARWIPHGIMQLASAVCFLGFGIWTLRGDPHRKKVHTAFRYPVLVIASTLFLMEFGDKTMLATVALAGTMDWLPVWLGATGGMVLADTASLIAGRAMGKTIPEEKLKWIAAILFFIFAAWTGWQAYESLSGRAV